LLVSGEWGVACAVPEQFAGAGLALADGGAALEVKGYDPFPGFGVWARVGWKRVE